MSRPFRHGESDISTRCVGRFGTLSWPGWSESTRSSGARAGGSAPDHAATEALLRGSGLALTALRNGFYTSSGRMLLGRAFETGEVAAPLDGPVSWTAHDDLADAAAFVLADEGRLAGVTPPLTGPPPSTSRASP